ncbi:hypothetical protein CYMTET_30324 [Cymbomonas tetramitiformis]|uniref:Uncharacterized protein n=1 Tax=Cymbomonas tetramitiformis TaxID=36881 RepID=A0AAE0KUB3_9CHLO|nr:hypothetical protein CYMTET_30324 [Cymbomonas tetramitiformis]
MTTDEATAEMKAFVFALERLFSTGGVASGQAWEDVDTSHSADDYQEGSMLNWHWLPQVSFYSDQQHRLLPITFYGRTEHFAEDWPKVRCDVYDRVLGYNPA